MTAAPPDNPRAPGFSEALLCFGVILLIIAVGLFGAGIGLHSLLFVCLLWTGLNARRLGCSSRQLREFMGAAISRALPAIYIFILIGMVIASFMHSGTIAALMYYGLNWITPAWFPAMGLVLCALMSVATGTSWGTVGTLGVVLMGMGAALDIPLPIVAGMVVCGATFGDKMSPVSDTTNLAAMSAETGLYRHIHAMALTTAPSFLLTLVIFAGMGLAYGEGVMVDGELNAIRAALAENYGLNPIPTLAPILVLAVLSFRRVPAEIAMAAGIVTAVLVAVLYQQHSLVQVMNALWVNTPGETSIESLDELLGRGGMMSMAWTLLLALLALALGGILHGAGFVAALLGGLIARVRRTAALVATTIGSGLLGNMAMGEAYISIILNCQLFRDRYRELKLDQSILSRSVEEGSTLTTGLIPWTTAGAFYAGTLGVPVLEYAPFAFFNYLNALVSITMAALGIGLMSQGLSREASASLSR